MKKNIYGRNAFWTRYHCSIGNGFDCQLNCLSLIACLMPLLAPPLSSLLRTPGSFSESISLLSLLHSKNSSTLSPYRSTVSPLCIFCLPASIAPGTTLALRTTCNMDIDLTAPQRPSDSFPQPFCVFPVKTPSCPFFWTSLPYTTLCLAHFKEFH